VLAVAVAGCGTDGNQGHKGDPDQIQLADTFADTWTDSAQDPEALVDTFNEDHRTDLTPGDETADGVPEDTDASAPPDQLTPAGLSVAGPLEWRALVTIFFDCQLPQAQEPAELVVYFSPDGSSFFEATAASDLSSGSSVFSGSHRFVWDSMADVTEDLDAVRIQVQLRLKGGETLASMTKPFPLMNRLDRDRTLLVSHYLDQSNTVRPLRFQHAGGLVPDGPLLTVGTKPVRIVMDDAGKVAVVFNDGDQSLDFLAISKTGEVVSIGNRSFGQNFADGFYTPDGSGLYLLNYNSQPGAGVYRLDTHAHTRSPEESAEPVLVFEHYVASRIVSLPDGSGYATVSSSKSDPRGSLIFQVVSFQGQLLAEQYFSPDGSLARGLAVTAYGGGMLALVSYFNLFGEPDQVVLFHIDEAFQITLVQSLAVSDPEDVLFTSDGWHAVVSEGEGNRVAGLKITPEPLGVQVIDRVVLGLALTMGSCRYGADADRFFVSTIGASTGESGLGVVTLQDGVLTKHSTYVLGTGIDVIPAGVAIQP
jgi:hypothetical protein